MILSNGLNSPAVPDHYLVSNCPGDVFGDPGSGFGGPAGGLFNTGSSSGLPLRLPSPGSPKPLPGPPRPLRGQSKMSRDS